MRQLEVNGSKVYVSRYSNKAINNEEFTPVSISLGLPKFPIKYEISKQIYMLAPGRNYFRASEDVFTAKYVQGIEELGLEKIMSVLEKLTEQGKDLVLLCFEDTDKDFCHRTLLAEWLEKKTGLKVLELADPSKKVEKESRSSQIKFW